MYPESTAQKVLPSFTASYAAQQLCLETKLLGSIAVRAVMRAQIACLLLVTTLVGTIFATDTITPAAPEPHADPPEHHDGAEAHHGLSESCLQEVNNFQCQHVTKADAYHPTLENAGRTQCPTRTCVDGGSPTEIDPEKCEADQFTPTNQACTASSECTTCTRWRCIFCTDSEEDPNYSEPLGVKFLFIVTSLLLGAVISLLLEKMPLSWPHPPFTVLMFVLGFTMAYMSKLGVLGCAISDSVNAWKHQDAHAILFTLLPPLLFESAFNVNYHVFIKVLPSSVTLASGGVIVSTGLLGLVFYGFFHQEFQYLEYCNPKCEAYDPTATERNCFSYPAKATLEDGITPMNMDCAADAWTASFMFGAIVSATDPVAVVAALAALGAPPKLNNMIEGESLLNDGSAVVVFLVCRGLLHHTIDGDGMGTSLGKMCIMVLRLAGGGILFGIAAALVVYTFLRMARDLNTNTSMTVMVLSVYMVFYMAEHWIGASGVLAVVVFGLVLNKRYAVPHCLRVKLI
jgi:hypothetical protein